MHAEMADLRESARLPELDGVDFLIAMGGPMSVNDDDELPWLGSRKAFHPPCRRGRQTGPGGSVSERNSSPVQWELGCTHMT